MKRKYLISEYWDGGHSDTADTLKEAKAKARKMRDGVRWTAAELRQHKRRAENYIIIERAIYDDDEKIEYNDIICAITINEKTLHRIY